MLAGESAVTPELLFWLLWQLPLEQLMALRLAKSRAADEWPVPFELGGDLSETPLDLFTSKTDERTFQF